MKYKANKSISEKKYIKNFNYELENQKIKNLQIP